MSFIACFTSISLSYLGRARVMATTLKEHHVDWHLTAVITDECPPGYELDLDDEPFDRVIWISELGVENWRAWLFEHDVVEACTAVKGPALSVLLDSGASAVVYIDPDIAVFNALETVLLGLEHHSILLTPHQTEPEVTADAILDNEIASFRWGTYNLGFVAVRNDADGRRFTEWWRSLLIARCYDETDAGVFVDQRWCNLVPAFFERAAVLRDPGLNVASWNLSTRPVTFDADGALAASGSSLSFFHFTKLGVVGETMTAKYADESSEVFELWAWYMRLIEEHTETRIPPGWWAFGTFDDGQQIPSALRHRYRMDSELRARYPDPFSSGTGTLQDWWTDAHR